MIGINTGDILDYYFIAVEKTLAPWLLLASLAFSFGFMWLANRPQPVPNAAAWTIEKRYR